MATVITTKGDVRRMINSSMESMIDTQSINNNQVTNLTHTTQIIVTPENGNPIEEKGEISNSSPNVQTIQPMEQPLIEPDVGGSKPPGKEARKSVLAPYETADLTAIAKETQPKGENEKHNRRTKSWFATAQGLKEGEDPQSTHNSEW